MYIVKIDFIDAVKKLPNAVESLLKTLDNTLYTTKSINDISWYYAFDVEDIDTNFLKKIAMSFNERLEYELKHLKCYLYMKMVDTNTYTQLSLIPDVINDLILEYVKVLIEEQEKLTHNEIIKLFDEFDANYDLDDILDKISEQGINSLTPFEKIFLDRYNNEK